MRLGLWRVYVCACEEACVFRQASLRTDIVTRYGGRSALGTGDGETAEQRIATHRVVLPYDLAYPS